MRIKRKGKCSVSCLGFFSCHCAKLFWQKHLKKGFIPSHSWKHNPPWWASQDGKNLKQCSQLIHSPGQRAVSTCMLPCVWTALALCSQWLDLPTLIDLINQPSTNTSHSILTVPYWDVLPKLLVYVKLTIKASQHRGRIYLSRLPKARLLHKTKHPQ